LKASAGDVALDLESIAAPDASIDEVYAGCYLRRRQSN
jgi:hypothetical protein